MLGEKFGVDEESYRAQHPRLGELAFDSDRKLMSTLHDIDGCLPSSPKEPSTCC